MARRAKPLPASDAADLKLRPGEEILWQSAGIPMIEMADGGVGVFKPLPSVYSATRKFGGYGELQAPNSHRGHGHVVITNQRVFFDGNPNRDWHFSQLVAVVHGRSTPMTLMRVSSRQRLSGFVFPGAIAKAFQFHLSLGLAEYQKDRAGFIAHLAKLVSDHDAGQPVPPPLVSPLDAPKQVPGGLLRLIFGPPGASAVRRLTPVLSTLVVLICVAAALATPPESTRDRSPAGLTGVVTTTSHPAPPVAAPTTSASSTAPAPAAVVTPTTQTPPAPAPTKSSKPPAEATCGAPANPWGYDFCAGGSTINNPPANFCSYFSCIASFWENTNGYVMQCDDGMFSHSGGRSGSCSRHGGNRRALTT